jgi:phytoene desaturase (3,4-didehydrolycopene-forming)
VPQLSAHNIFLNGDYKKSFDDIFKNSGLPQHPSFYIHVPSRIDPSASPERGKDAVTVLVPISCIKADHLQDWDKLADYARKYVFNVFNTKFGFDIADHIITERINTPLTWRDKFNLHHGAALGLNHNVTQIGWMRPSICHDKYDNMFFVGASVHPGTGVPIVLHGAALVEDEVQHYLSTGKKRKPSIFSSWVVLLYLFLILLVLFFFVL